MFSIIRPAPVWSRLLPNTTSFTPHICLALASCRPFTTTSTDHAKPLKPGSKGGSKFKPLPYVPPKPPKLPKAQPAAEETVSTDEATPTELEAPPEPTGWLARLTRKNKQVYQEMKDNLKLKTSPAGSKIKTGMGAVDGRLGRFEKKTNEVTASIAESKKRKDGYQQDTRTEFNQDGKINEDKATTNRAAAKIPSNTPSNALPNSQPSTLPIPSDNSFTTTPPQHTVSKTGEEGIERFEGVYEQYNTAPDWVKKYVVKARLSTLEEPPELTNTERLLKPFLFTTAVVLLCIWIAYNYTPQRLFPSLPVAVETLAPIIALNFAVLVLWRFPPAWRFLNTYFLTVPALPHAWSMLGNMFSHQRLWHFSTNMALLYLLGSTLCDQIGPSNFLALYFGSGVFASFMSLAFNVLLKRWEIYGFGASGAVYGVIGAYGWINPDRDIFFILLPLFHFKAWTILACVGTWELTALVMAWSVTIDHMAHLSGLVMGAWLVSFIKDEAKRRERKVEDEYRAMLLAEEEQSSLQDLLEMPVKEIVNQKAVELGEDVLSKMEEIKSTPSPPIEVDAKVIEKKGKPWWKVW